MRVWVRVEVEARVEVWRDGREGKRRVNILAERGVAIAPADRYGNVRFIPSVRQPTSKQPRINPGDVLTR